MDMWQDTITKLGTIIGTGEDKNRNMTSMSETHIKLSCNAPPGHYQDPKPRARKGWVGKVRSLMQNYIISPPKLVKLTLIN